ncbi:MAG: 2-haloacid dehalogenase [Kosmotogales bacterium]|nr:2-haloacid dehalogenase [Kosmotogales bacterium]
MKIVYFDLDNTILDFDKCEREALKDLMIHYNLEFSDDHLSSYSEINKKCWQDYERGLLSKEKLREERFKIFFRSKNIEIKNNMNPAKDYLEFLKEKSYFIPGAERLLKKLKEKNHKMACLTNGIKEVQSRRTKKANLDEYFDFILTSEEIGKPKPDPLIFERASEISGIELKDSLYIGDSLSSDFLGAENAGVEFILFWNKPLSILKKEKRIPKNICTNFSDLYNMIREI